MQRRAVWLLGLAAAALSILVYLNSLPAPFLLDDIPAVVENPGAQWPLDAEGIFARNYWGNRRHYEALTIYRPLATLTFALTDGIAPGDCPACHRVVNVLLHAACTLLLFLLVLELAGTGARGSGVGKEAVAASVAAALFAVHPVHTEAVVGIVSRAELLAALFVLWGALLYARRFAGATRPRHRDRALLALVFALALLSKENGATLWGVVIGFQFVTLGKALVERRRPLPRPDWQVHVWLCGVLAAYLALRWAVLPGILAGDLSPADNPIVGAGLLARVLTPMAVFYEYLRLLLVPVSLTIDYSLNHVPPVQDVLDPRAWAGIAGAAGLLAAAVLALRRHAVVSILILAFFATYVVVSNWLFLSTIIMAERLIYLPSAFFVAAATVAALGLPRRLMWAALLAGLVVMAGFAARTVARNQDWRSAAALYTAAVETAPDSAKSRHLLARELVRQERLDAAVPHFAAAVALDGENFVLRTNYARTLARLGRFDAALKELEAALSRAPSYRPAFHLVCAIFERTGKPAGARQHCFPGGVKRPQ